METNKLIAGIVAAAIAIIVLAGVLMPALSNATTNEDTFTNEGIFYVEVDPTDTYKIEYDKSLELGVVYINDEAMDVPFSTGYTILALDQSILRLQSGDSTLQYKGNGSYMTGIIKIDLTVSSGSVTGTYQTTTSGGVDANWPTTTYTECHIASPDKQSYIMTEYNSTVKMNGDSDIFAFGQTTVNNVLYLMKIEGNIDDGVNVSVLNSTTGAEVSGAVITNLSINATADSTHIDLYDLSSITFTVTLADSSTANVTYSAYIVPSEVTAERSVHLSDAMNVILNVIPLLIIVAVLLGVVAVFILRRE